MPNSEQEPRSKHSSNSGLSQEQDNPLYSYLNLLLSAGASMARHSLRFVRLILGLSLFCLFAGLAYLMLLQDAHWILSLVYALITATPAVLLAFYAHMLGQLREAPQHLEAFKDSIIRVYESHPEKAREIMSHQFASITRWKTYRLIGGIIKDLASGADQALTLTGNIKSLSLMANPLFWLSLILSLIISITLSGILILSFSLHAWLT
ncbi:hypothetical protein HW115_06730 [Verrucomicrobiaceae bacterium N1E253]|uniref:Uncharacterized protein n=1 Tax=Oceaniferula marina TaxID=2748318 RepID=A0A851GC35_9BACT|nr:hypothetical protein [Oceaniferula marina]NWK55298.1 hypothetical protein [Oceaniferula marina]